MGESRRQFHRARLVSSSPPCWRVATGNPPRPLENYCPWKGDGPPSLSPSATPFSLSLLGTEGDEWWASWGGFRPAESCAPCARSSTSGKNSIPRLKGMTRSSGPYSSSRPGNFHETALASFSFFFFFITHAHTHTRSLSLSSNVLCGSLVLLGLYFELSAAARASWHHRPKPAPLESFRQASRFHRTLRWFKVEVISKSDRMYDPLLCFAIIYQLIIGKLEIAGYRLLFYNFIIWTRQGSNSEIMRRDYRNVWIYTSLCKMKIFCWKRYVIPKMGYFYIISHILIAEHVC